VWRELVIVGSRARLRVPVRLIYFAGPFADFRWHGAGLANLASSTGTFCWTSLSWIVKRPFGRASVHRYGNLHSVGVAVIGVIDLGRKQPERGVAITDQSQQQSGLLVEVQLERRLALALADYSMSLVVADSSPCPEPSSR
jgi:hypothetical protein